MNAQEPGKEAAKSTLNAPEKDAFEVNYVKRFIVICLIAVAIPLLLIAPQQSESQSAKSIKSQEEAMREYMIVISRQLGTTCTACHDTANFRKDDMKNFKVAKEHMKLTQLLIDGGMDGKKGPKADCYMCHQGQMKYSYKEPVNPLTK